MGLDSGFGIIMICLERTFFNSRAPYQMLHTLYHILYIIYYVPY